MLAGLAGCLGGATAGNDIAEGDGPVAGATQVSRSFSELFLVSVVLAELAAVFGIAFPYYGGATGGPVIVLVAVTIYVATVGLGRLQTALGGEQSTELGAVDAEDRERASD